MKRQDRIERIRAIEREYQAAAVAVDLLEEQLQADPALGRAGGWRLRDARNLRANLETTFLIRLFAEFESGLRDAWQYFFRRTTHPPMKDLLSAIAALRLVPQDWLDGADSVREYRNGLVHEGTTGGQPVPIREARRLLCSFLSRLPPDW
jgi:hypothetical protein